MDIDLKCRCGTLRGKLVGYSKSQSNRMICFCEDCQAYAHFLGCAPEVLDPNGGTDIFPTTQSQWKLLHGAEHLQCIRLSPKGMYRWYAGCCKTPLANSMAATKMPFAGTFRILVDSSKSHKKADELLGPIRGGMLAKYAIGKPEGAHQTVSPRIIFSVLRFLIPAILKRAHQPSPFFHKTGEPRVAPYVLTIEERSALRPLCGPRP